VGAPRGGAPPRAGLDKVDNAIHNQAPPAKPPAAKAHILRDLVQNDLGQADLGDFQMILITLVAVALFLTKAFSSMSEMSIIHDIYLPDVDTTLLSVFGIGQGAYLVKKAALDASKG
jgi:hypothetical protein